MRPAGKNKVPGAQGWKQPSKVSGQESVEEVDERLLSIVSELTETVGEGNVLKALGLTLNGERVAQHALVSGLLALEVLVTGSLPAAMLTQVVHRQGLCCVAPCHLQTHIFKSIFCLLSCGTCVMSRLPALPERLFIDSITALNCPFSVLCTR